MDVLMDAAAGTVGVLVELSRALLGSPLGHAVLRVVWHLVDPTLLVLYVAFKYAIGPALMKLSKDTRARVRSGLISASHLLLTRSVVTAPFRELVCSVLLELVLVRHGREAQEDLEMFLRLGEGKKSRQRAVKWGSGRSNDFFNRFFPSALAQGPSSPEGSASAGKDENEDEQDEGEDTEEPKALFCGTGNDEVTNLVHLQIAETALLMSILCYRSDAVIVDCLRSGMLPSVRFYSVHTSSEIDLAIFVAQEWAIFCFRGTEMETVRGWLTSSLVEETMPFGAGGGNSSAIGGGRRVRRRYYQSMRAACGESLARRYVVEPPISLPGQLDATAMDLVKLLYSDGVKIYATGHSLGGGMATLFGAHIREHLGIAPAAVITFGSPPVAGNDRFVRWYRRSVSCSWRFVHGNELAPLSPPLPFFMTSVRFLHVDSATDVSRLRRSNSRPVQRTCDEEEAHLDQLARNLSLSSAVLDHNPVLTMRILHLELSRAEHAVSSLSLID